MDARTVDQAQLLKGVLDLAVLVVLRRGDNYGYDIVRQLQDVQLGDVAEVSVYGTLRRLYRDGLVSSYVRPSESGPPRKYYGVTADGHTYVTSALEQWTRFTTAMSDLITT